MCCETLIVIYNLSTERNNQMKKSFNNRIIEVARAQAVFRPRDLERLGIPREYLLRLMRQGVVRRTGRGLYELSDLSPTEHHSLAAIAKEVPRGVICLLSALRFHGLTTQHPAEVWIGIHVRARRPKKSTVSLRVVRYSEQTLNIGAKVHRIEGISVRVFSPAKTVADCLKYRKKVGLDVAIEALRDALHQKKAPIAELIRYAELDRVSRIMRPYLEALV
jgi:predicted transcriptional regulator of viral defense system